ncbi:glycerate kinase [Burkholderia sp. PU8-34]
MKIVIAPDSFKESLSALEVADAIEAGFREVFPDAFYVKVPVADGGEGTLQALIDATGGTRRTVDVVGPLGASVKSSYGYTAQSRLAVIEMAAASGLGLVPPPKRDPRITTTFGTGQLIMDALDVGARRFVIGIGGSATNDGGAGMIQALGVRLLDATGNEIGYGGAELARLAQIDVSGLDKRMAHCQIDVACDVTNPLVGPRGASAIYGPQKGATTEMVEQLDQCLLNFASVLHRDLGRDVADIPGAGAGGGIGAALLAVLNARLRPGCEVVTETIDLVGTLSDADLVITGEGRTDSQTINGKTPIGVARAAAVCGVPVIGLAGSLSHDSSAVHAHGIGAVFSAVRHPCSVEDALRDAAFNVRSAARNIASVLRMGMQVGVCIP